ncbi:RNA polymerase sigma factor [Lentisphaera marina]|uniref:RNA polymerase sigma factor n=1 Tax=Lentisphaera marina TaxID=1111041 RepID=UPI0023673A7C|nr:RNA polymerase sigma factor [Lentisphaera marina]MDD7986612.1 RNA polymerase sigma factor [Lentisphaera marina]
MNQTRLTLIQRAQNPDDETAWNEFVEVYKNYIYVVIRQMGINDKDCEDILQQVLIKLWKKLPDFEYGKNKSKFRTWLGVITHSTTVDFFRKQSSQNRRLEDATREQVAHLNTIDKPEIEEMAEREWRLYITNLAMANIEQFFSGKAIDVFKMSMKGQSNEKISSELEIKIDTVYILKNRVKKRLTDEIKRLKNQFE